MTDQERELRNNKTLFTELMKTPLQTFPPLRGKLIAPKKQVVYEIRDPSGIVDHVGKTDRAKEGGHQRLRAHMSGSSSYVIKYLKGDRSKLRNKYQFRCIVVDDPRLRALFESYAVGQLCPRHLGTGEQTHDK